MWAAVFSTALPKPGYFCKAWPIFMLEHHNLRHVGEYSFTGMGTSLGKDLPPFVMAFGAPGIPRGINNEGLKRHGFGDDTRKQIKNAYRVLYRQDLPFKEAIGKLKESSASNQVIKQMADFCERSQTGRGIIR
jgi:UDP-N-acetylglucosamine acyltransferase